MNRREFVKSVGLAAVAGASMDAVGSQAGATQSDTSAGKAKWARLLPGCCAYSYHEALRHGSMTMEDFILKAVELRLTGVDMTAYYLKSTDSEYLHSLRHLAYKHAVAFSGCACGVSMVQADAQKRAG